jgi:hypothetical protein
MKRILITSICLHLIAAAVMAQEGWRELTSVDQGTQSRLQPSHWPYDKYPDMPEITPKSKTVLLDADGPGVVTLIHVSQYKGGDQAKLILRVWYDSERTAAIEMPWMDFLGDVEAQTAPFSTVYFSHVKESHNFRLPMPFRKHIRIEVENPTDSKSTGYTDIQWERVAKLPSDIGSLRVAYSTGEAVIPDTVIEICSIKGAGSIVAHWLQLRADEPATRNSDLICEGNHGLYLDGASKPQLEYLGSEDLYGYSWGMASGLQSDHYAAITQMDHWRTGGLFTMLRCRGADRISFASSCRWLLDYRHEFFSAMSANPRHRNNPKRSFPMLYRSAVYYYAAKP